MKWLWGSGAAVIFMVMSYSMPPCVLFQSSELQGVWVQGVLGMLGLVALGLTGCRIETEATDS